MNIRFQDYVSLAVMSLALGLQGCGGGDSHVKNIASPVDNSVAASLVGTAVKGVIANADCVVTAADQTTVLYTSVGKTTACTDANGAYTIELDTVPTGPVILELLARTGTTMKCDYPTGCGTAIFGEDVALGSDFSLRAIVPSVSGTTLNQVNVTPWSELAAARAIFETDGGTLVAADVQSAQLDVAAILNNLLGLEGSADAFGSDLLSIDPINLNAPTGTATSETKRGSLLSLASASLFSLVGGSFTDIEAVIKGLVAAFEEDGEFNVNDSATTGLDGTNIDLADMLTSIASTASNLPSEIATTINTLLGSGTTLTSIANEATSFAELKEAVVDAAQDSTKPQPPAAAGVSDADKTKQLALDLDNALAAGFLAFTAGSSSTSVLQDLGTILENSQANSGAHVINKLENLSELIEAANRMIQAKVDPTGLGCTVDAGVTITCSLEQAAALVDNDMSYLYIGTGDLIYTYSTNAVTTSNAVILADSYALNQVGTSATVNTLSVASVDLDDDSTTDISLGAGSTISTVLTSSTPTSFSVDAKSVAITIGDYYSFAGDLKITRDLTIADTVLSNVDMNGTFTVLRANDTITHNLNESIATRLKFTTNTSSLTGAPSLETLSETTNSFYTISDVVFQVEQDVTYNKESFDTAGAVVSGSTEEHFVLLISGTRNSFELADAKLRISLLSDSASKTLAGSIALTDGQETYTLSNGQAKAVIVVGATTFTGTLMVGATNTGSIESTGLVTLEGGDSFQLGTWAVN